MVKTKPLFLMVFLSFLLVLTNPMGAQALTLDFDFFRITNNNVENVESQLDAVAYDQEGALTAWDQSIQSNEVLFVFTNNVGVASNITEVYFDDGTLLAQTNLLNSLSGVTDFESPPIEPGNLPSGNNVLPPFVATASFGADVTSGPPANGVNTADDALGIVIQLMENMGWDDLVAAVASGDLRLGLHVRSIGAAGGSDSFVSGDGGAPPQVVPEPATMLLLGLGLIGLAGISRKKWSR